MSESISIKVSIGGRKYPLSVAKKDESLVQEIAGDLDKTLETLQNNYSVNDKQDLIAMAALQVSTKRALNQTTKSNSTEPSESMLEDLQSLLDRSNHLV